MSDVLPPGQFLLDEFPRFGLGKFARRFPTNPDQLAVRIGGDVERPLSIGQAQLAGLERVEIQADFHCVTCWSVRNQRWSGYRFADFYAAIVRGQAGPEADANLVVLRAADGYASSLPLEDLLAGEVLLADRLDGEPLGIKHGAPLRLVAPTHYGYKNVKHLTAIEFWRDARNYRFPRPYPKLMDHPRARVALEERTRWLPAWLIRPLYRRLIRSTIRNFRKALGG